MGHDLTVMFIYHPLPCHVGPLHVGSYAGDSRAGTNSSEVASALSSPLEPIFKGGSATYLQCSFFFFSPRSAMADSVSQTLVLDFMKRSGNSLHIF